MPADSARCVCIVAAADDHYAMPLGVMLRSVVNHTIRELRLFVIDGGITPDNKKRVTRAAAGAHTQLDWLTPDNELLAGMKINGHVTRAAYLRLQVGELLPKWCRKVIYLDCDLIVLADIGELRDLPMAGKMMLAAQDLTAPYMDAEVVRQESSIPRLWQRRPLALFRELGIPSTALYFNSGVLMIDIETWRAKEAGARVRSYLREKAAQVRWWDQDGLNAVLWNEWAVLSPTWNQTPTVFAASSWRETPFDEATFAAVREHPRIVHFAASGKPWHCNYSHPYATTFVRNMARTPWGTSTVWLWLAQNAYRIARYVRSILLRSSMGMALAAKW